MTHKIIDNLLSEELSEKIKNDLIGDSAVFPWYYNTWVVNAKKNDSLYECQFTHTFFHRDYDPSSYLPNLKCIIEYLNPQHILRIKANLNPRTEVRNIFGYHVDFPGAPNDIKTAIYYVNSNDGVTIFEDGTEIESVANRLVIFDQKTRHTGTTCTNQKVRCLINFNYTERLDD
jgi:hypothetical protein